MNIPTDLTDRLKNVPITNLTVGDVIVLITSSSTSVIDKVKTEHVAPLLTQIGAMDEEIQDLRRDIEQLKQQLSEIRAKNSALNPKAPAFVPKTKTPIQH